MYIKTLFVLCYKLSITFKKITMFYQKDKMSTKPDVEIIPQDHDGYFPLKLKLYI
jgi:hypothetical protein